jgi:5-phospho-D-xylono-1,4-lactonase
MTVEAEGLECVQNQQEQLITTVTGTIRPSEIGFCHSHEHLFLKEGKAAKLDPALVIDDFDKTIKELNLFKSVGGTTIVDAQPVGSGRNSEWLAAASQKTGVKIIASTGFHKLVFYPEDHWIHTVDEQKLSELFIDELKNGMYADGDTSWPRKQTTAKPGIIKTASDLDGVGGPVYRLFKAAAFAAKETGAPIMSHTEMGRSALDQIKLYTDLGLPSNQLIICHLERKMDNMDYLLHVASTGVFLELDTIGRFKYHSDEEEAELIVKLIEAGYESQILLGLDTTRKRLKSYGGELGLDYLSQHFIPLLESYGVSKTHIHKMVHSNPARAFSKHR